MENLINIGVAQFKTAEKSAVLRTILGSCAGICIYDRMKKIGGLAHILLPTSPGSVGIPEKYADTAIPLMVQQLIKMGAKKEFMSAKITGGSAMFKFSSNSALGQIGNRNIEETRIALEKQGITIVEEDTGGSSGRVIDFFLEDGRLKVKSNGTEKYYYKV